MIGEAVVIVRPGTRTDGYGEKTLDWSTATQKTVRGCAVAARRTADDEEITKGRQSTIVGLVVYMPPGTDVRPSDRMRIRGEVHEVIGLPADWRNPFTGRAKGIEVDVQRVEG